MRKSNRLLRFLLWFILLPLPGTAQFLAWDFVNVTDDRYESGVNPDMLIDAAGTTHVSYWHRAEDKLIYAFQLAGDTAWHREYVDITGQNGYVSAIAQDASGGIHIAYQENDGFVAQVRFASRTGTNAWTVESIPGEPGRGWGAYGPNGAITEKERVVHSIDLIYDEFNSPQIVFFDGWMDIDAFPGCTSTSQYGFQLHQAFKLNGFWKTRSLGEIPDQNLSCGTGANPDSLPTGDRYGEYVNLLQRPDGRMEIFCLSRFNNKLIAFRNVAPTSDTLWTYSEIDSIPRILVPGLHAANRFLTIEGISAIYGPGDVTHLAYSTSIFYGENFCCLDSANELVYTRISPDTTIHRHFGANISEGTYRNHIGLVCKGTDSVYFAYADLSKGQFLLQASVDSGKTWALDTIVEGIGISRVRLEVQHDSLEALLYLEANNNLVIARRHVNGGAWSFENVTTSERKGQVMDALIVPANGDTIAHIVYADQILQRLYYATGAKSNGWNWSIERLDSLTNAFNALSFARTSSGSPVLVYAGGMDLHPRMATKMSGGWRYEMIDSTFGVAFTDVEVSPLDSIHIVYYDAQANCLKYAVRHLLDSTFTRDVIDCAQQPVGQYPSMQLDAQGNPHVAYFDGNQLSLKYAQKDPQTRAWDIDSVNSNGSSRLGKFASLKFGLDGLPKIAYLDEQASAVYLSEKNSLGLWRHQIVDSAAISNLGRPIRMDIDRFGRPWIAYNYFSNFDKVKLVRRDGNVFQEVAVSQTGQIANAFSFQVVGPDLYLTGRKNQLAHTGVGMLYAAGGLHVPIENAGFRTSEITAFPNPFSGSTTFRVVLQESQSLSLRVFDLHGKTIAQVLKNQTTRPGTHHFSISAQGWAPGIYFYELSNSQSRIVKKLVISPN